VIMSTARDGDVGGEADVQVKVWGGENEAGGNGRNKIGGASLFFNFAPKFLLSQCMEFTFSYGRWKRDILSLLGTNIGP